MSVGQVDESTGPRDQPDERSPAQLATRVVVSVFD